MVGPYPVLKKAPYLLPFCWLARCIKAIFDGKSKRFSSELTYVGEVSEQKGAEIMEMCSRLGLE